MPSNVQIDPGYAVEKVLDFMTAYVQTHQVPPQELPGLIAQLMSYTEPVAAVENAEDSTHTETVSGETDSLEQEVEVAPKAVMPPVKRGRGRPPKPYIPSPNLANLSKVPAVDPKDSVFPDHLICLIDGKKVVMIKRYLNTHYGITVEDYKRHFNLPADYPTCAPNHSEVKRKKAAEIGLGYKKAA